VTTTTSVALYRGDVPADFVADLRAAGQVGCDIETTGLDFRSDTIGTVQLFAPSTGAAVVQIDAGVVPSRLCDLLEWDNVQKIFHFAPFDLRFLRYHWKVRARNIACTKVASRILNPDLETPQHSLQPLLKRYLNVHIDKGAVRTSDWTANELTEEQLAYAVKDVAYLPDLLDILMSHSRAVGLADVIERSFAYLPVRVETDLRGCGDVFAYA
jgi:ribonuclease D